MTTAGAPKAPSANVLYRDRRIECTDTAVVIHGYYFPFGSKKTIPYDRIKVLSETKLGIATGQWRIWGSGDFKHWFNWDPGRTRKTRALILDVGTFARPVITPDDVDKVAAIIRSKTG
jgi:hypothetical protein